mmetsp:Transcript_43009/g.103682  ORF Transcript_43009/g.103682 Transcript_43009/m.103682 type:complete len:229 (+) Transcript_43009:1476-2162(+)
MIVHSTDLIDTGSSIIPKTHAPSQGAGHTRPVNSGKLFVSSSRRSASCQLPCRAKAFHSGIRFPNGQPLLSVTAWWQNGVPQSMHRPACVRTSLMSVAAVISRKSVRRSLAGLFAMSLRLYTTKPRFWSIAGGSTTVGRLARSSMSPVLRSAPRSSGLRSLLLFVSRGIATCFSGGKCSFQYCIVGASPAVIFFLQTFAKSMGRTRQKCFKLLSKLDMTFCATEEPVN